MSTDLLPVARTTQGPVTAPPRRRGVDLAPKLFVLLLLCVVTLLGAVGLTMWMQTQSRLSLQAIAELIDLETRAEALERSFDQCAESADALVITHDSGYRTAVAQLRDQVSSDVVAVQESARGRGELELGAERLGVTVETQLREIMAIVSDARFVDSQASARAAAYHAQVEGRLAARRAITQYRDEAAGVRGTLSDKARESVRFASWMGVGCVALAILFLCGTGWVLWFGWSRRLSRLMTNLSRLSRSDLAREAVEGTDELARLDRAIDEIVSALIAMREWERAILMNIPVGLFALKPNGQVSWVSKRMATELEYERPDLEGHSIFMLASKQEETRLREFVETLARGGRMADWEVHLVTRTGRSVLMRLSGSSPQGLDMVCVAQNVAERQAAQTTSARLTQVTEQMPDPVLEFTEDFEVIYMNQAARERFPELSRDGTRHPAFQGTSALIKLLRDGDAPTVNRQFGHMGRAYDQRILYLPTQRAYRAYCHDVSALIKAADDIRRSRDALEKSDTAKAETLSRVSADLAGPSKSLVGFVGLLREDPGLASNSSALKSLERMAAHIMQIQALSKNIEDLQRLEKGEVSMVAENINVRWILLDVVAQVAPLATPRSVRFQGIDSGPDVYVWADRPQLQMALTELFGSLARYSRVGGNVILNWVSTENMVRLAISAVGATVAMDAFKNSARSATGAESLGVGFSVARRIMEQMSGRLAVSGQTGTSLTLTLELPQGTRTGTMDAAPAAEFVAPLDPPPGPPFTVLYIDDSSVAVELAQAMLASRTDIIFESAGRGDEGISKARRIRPHLIVLDMKLPDMGGLDVLRILKAEPGTQRIPIVALTADASDEDRRKALQAGLQRFMTKPLSTKSLLDAIAEFLPSAEV